MTRAFSVALLLLSAYLAADAPPAGKYRPPAAPEVVERWTRDYLDKRALVPPAPPPLPSSADAVDFSGAFVVGPWGYELRIDQSGDRVALRAGGVDRQDNGGAFETLGAGVVREGKLFARWWCVDLSRNVANNGGAEIRFLEGSRDRIHIRYYHDADETIEEGYGARAGTQRGETLPYRVRVAQPARDFPDGVELKGTVRGRGGEAIEDAVVMLRHEEKSAVRSDARGAWTMTLRRLPAVCMAAAAAPGYRNAVEAILFQELRELHFVLDPAGGEDDPRYVFVDPTPDKGREVWRCGNCHRVAYAEWSASRHAVAASSAVTRAVYLRDFLPALAAGAAEGDEGLCAACHAPEAALADPRVRLDAISGTARLGNHCDVCHKAHHVEDLDAPGVRGSLAVRRPSVDDVSVPGPIKRVYGALADSDYLFMGSAFNPFFATSALCAGCHQYETASGLPALDTYSEWLRWAAGREERKSCQECHMPSGVSMDGNAPARRVCVHALARPGEQIHEHRFRGRELAPAAASLSVVAVVEEGELRVTTRVENKEAGHRMPTGSGDKHLLLVVTASDEAGNPLELERGPRVPDHAGGEGSRSPADAASLSRRREAGEFAGM
ncbi:MAG: multiheme c-type cytochrome, partial [Planctomycetota bacterium]